VTDPLTLWPGERVTPAVGVHHAPKWASSGISLAPWPAHPGAREISVGPGGVQLPPHQSPQWLPRRTPVSVMVVELLIAVQVYVLSTPVASDALVDDSLSVSSPSDEVADCKTAGAT
jgi:hypothetical protein